MASYGSATTSTKTDNNRPSEEARRMYELGKEAEANGDLKTAISYYKKAEKLGHSLEDEAPRGNQALHFEALHALVDEEGYVQAFTVEQLSEIVEFWNKYGFVVINDVLSESQVNDSIEDIWRAMAGYSTHRDESKKLLRDDPSTWEPPLWSSSPVGIIGNDIFVEPSSWVNRQSPKLYEACRAIFGVDELLVSPCRFGVMRPTKNIQFPDGVVKDKPEWRTNFSWFHWDLNPWEWFGLADSTFDLSEQMHQTAIKRLWGDKDSAAISFLTENNSNNDFLGFPKMQGLFSFSDAKSNDGGLQLIPGFHKHLKEWASKNPQFSSEGLVMVPVDDPMLQGVTRQGIEPSALAQRITQRKGSVVLWNSCLPHCNYPADGEKFRYCQYFKVFPACLIQPDLRLQRESSLNPLITGLSSSSCYFFCSVVQTSRASDILISQLIREQSDVGVVACKKRRDEEASVIECHRSR
eukprot:TRINITY_DN283_c0_g3_i3.p1 TRINITY_DN283_c0_g3~~TRINITY_DN283_c0_g3_i3.p1  ORF type:complete len:466 (+),score=101.83 TRINITY_DN283_c0_g3_i3:208-1605(+)